MQFWVYILMSESTGKLYCGQTSDLGGQIKLHNDPDCGEPIQAGKKNGPWGLLWSRGCESRFEAKNLERNIKKRGIGRFLFE
ncbi:GIY-YIG nuclease family protein [Thermodesulfobacteriota bacterium]